MGFFSTQINTSKVLLVWRTLLDDSTRNLTSNFKELTAVRVGSSEQVDMQLNVAGQEEDESSTCGSAVGTACIDYTSAFATDMIFSSREELIEWVRDTGKRNGLTIVIKNSDLSGDGRKPRMSFACERSGAYRRKNYDGQESKRRRTSGSKKCGCPFKLKGQKLATDDDWTLEVINGVHNHPASRNIDGGHSFAGRLTEQEANILIDMSKNNISPKEILQTLKQRDTHNASTIKAIYNARQKYKVGDQIGRSQIQQLMLKLLRHNYIECHRSNEDTRGIRDLFWVHPFALELLKAFPRVLLVDCTSKHNGCHLPLLEMVGVTSTELTFSVAFAYLQSEQEDNFVWALERLRNIVESNVLPSVIVTDKNLALMNAIQKVFPNATNLICRSHISRDILANCKKLFESKDRWEAFINSWNVLVLSTSEEEYMLRLNAMESQFRGYPLALNYVKQTWLVNYKEKFVAAWTNFIMHYGNVTMNRGKIVHSKLKRLLLTPQGNFETSWIKVHALIELQHTEIKASFERSLSTVRHNFEASIFKELRDFVSINAMNLIHAEFRKADSISIDASVCGCVLRHTHGLPCAHEICEYMLEGRPIPLSSIDPHWRKLDFTPSTHDRALELKFTAEIEKFMKRFNDTDGPGKKQLLKKLKELVDPIASSHDEPVVEAETQGQPYLTTGTSTSGDSSDYEYLSSTQDSHSPSSSSTTSEQPEGSQKEELYQTQSLETASSPIDLFPIGLRPYIYDVRNVVVDGHCGFRVIANLMGMGDVNWAQVRRELVDELQSHYDNYIQLYGDVGRVQKLYHSLSYFENSPGNDRWMIMPDTGHIIASRYNVVLLYISQQQCITFLPLRSMPLPRSSRKIIAIGFITGCHFVEVFMHPGSPMPPIASNWFRHRDPCAEGWETPYAAHIKVFRDLVSSHQKT